MELVYHNESLGGKLFAKTLAPCPFCEKTCDLNFVKMPPFSPHFAAKRCAGCDGFRGWVLKPENFKKWQDLKVQIQRALASNAVSQWERSFLESLLDQKKLSPKQQACLARISARLEGGAK